MADFSTKGCPELDKKAGHPLAIRMFGVLSNFTTPLWEFAAIYPGLCNCFPKTAPEAVLCPPRDPDGLLPKGMACRMQAICIFTAVQVSGLAIQL